MGVPKKRHSKSKVGRRRLHLKLEIPQLVRCPECNEFKLPHRVCPTCGYYKKEEVIRIEEEKK